MSSYNCYDLYLTFDAGQCIFCLGPRWTGLFDIVNRNDRPTRVRRAPRAKPFVSRHVSAFTRVFDALWRALLQRERRAGTQGQGFGVLGPWVPALAREERARPGHGKRPGWDSIKSCVTTISRRCPAVPRVWGLECTPIVRQQNPDRLR